MSEPEQALEGGNLNPEVVRVGDTVRRSAGSWTPAVHDLLQHLADRSYTAPRRTAIMPSCFARRLKKATPTISAWWPTATPTHGNNDRTMESPTVTAGHRLYVHDRRPGSPDPGQ